MRVIEFAPTEITSVVKLSQLQKKFFEAVTPSMRSTATLRRAHTQKLKFTSTSMPQQQPQLQHVLLNRVCLSFKIL